MKNTINILGGILLICIVLFGLYFYRAKNIPSAPSPENVSTTTSPTYSPPTGWKFFSNEDMGLQLYYPPSFTIQNEGSKYVPAEFVDTEKNTIEVTSFPPGPPTDVVIQWPKWPNKAAKDSVMGDNDKKLPSLTVDGRTFYISSSAIIDYTSNSTHTDVYSLYTPIIVTVKVVSGKFDSSWNSVRSISMEDIEKLLGSIKIIKQRGFSF